MPKQSIMWYVAAVLFFLAAIVSFIGGQNVLGGTFIAVGAVCAVLGYQASQRERTG